jgi:hypothetical protein
LSIILGVTLFPPAAFAITYLPGQTLNPACVPTDPTCQVVAPSATNVAAAFIATSTTATSTFAGGIAVSGTASSTDVVISNAFILDAGSGILKAVSGVVSEALVNLASDVTGVLPVANGGTASTTLTGILKGNGTGAVQTAIGGTDYEFPLTFSAPLSRTANAISIPQATGAANGYLASADWTNFNNKVSSTSLSAAYPLSYSSGTGVFSTNFSTTTNNTFSGINTFNGNTALGNATSTNLAVTGNVIVGGTASTSNFTVSTGFTFGNGNGILKAVSGVVSEALVNLASDVTGILPVGNGGIGTSTSPSYGQILVGNAAGGYNLVATSSLGITGGGGGSGTVTSITAGAGLTGGTITTSGTIALDLTNPDAWTGLQTFRNASSTNLSVFATAYFGGSATSSFNTAGQLALAGLTNSLLSVNNAGQVVATSSIGTNLLTGTLGIGNGGTGATTQQGALNAIAPTPTRAGDIIYYNGSNWTNLAGNNSGTQVLQETSGGVPSWAAAGGANYFTNASSNTYLNTGSNLEAPEFTATSTTVASSFQEASTTLFSASGTAYFGAAGNSSFSTAGVLSLVSNGLAVGSNQFVVSSGKVGIGTTSPVALFTVSGGDTRLQETTDSPTALVVANAAGSSTLQVSTLNSSQNVFEIATSTGAAYFDVTSGGNIGFGSTTPAATFGLVGSQYLTGGLGVGLVDSTAGTLQTSGNILAGGNLGIGTTTPGSALAVQGVGNFTGATSTFYSTGGINLTAGCFSVNGTCISGGGGGGSGTVTSISAGTGLTGGTITTSGTIALDLTHANSWTGLQQFTAGASSSQESIFQDAYFGGWIYSSGGTNALAASTSPTVNYITATSTTATSTFADGINLAGGCFSIAGTCITAGGGGGVSLSGNNNWTGLQTFSAGASTTTNLSVFANTWFGGTATSSFNTKGQLNLADQGTTGETLITLGGTSFLAASSSSSVGNTFLGLSAGSSITSGAFNTGFGYQALQNATTTSNNTAVGYLALTALTSGIRNNAHGSNALTNLTTGARDQAFGYEAQQFATSSTDNVAIGDQALRGSSSNSSGNDDIAIGTQTLFNNTSGSDNIAMGFGALGSNTTGIQNVALGNSALGTNSTANNNFALGYFALSNSTGANDVGIGAQSLDLNTTGANAVAIGQRASFKNTNADSSVAIGSSAASGPNSYSAQDYVAIGANAGQNFTDGANYNVLIGAGAGDNITSGAGNILIGPDTTFETYNNLLTGSQNIAIGYDIGLAGSTTNNQLNIQNIFFGTNNSATGQNISSGQIGIGTTSPYARFAISLNNGDINTTAFVIASSTANSTTTLFSVANTGNATLAGTLTQNSDQRLKTNIQSLDASDSLAVIDALNPVSFYWINDIFGSGEQLGFIAQDVQKLLPQLVSTTSPTALTPGGTLGLNYSGLISPIVSAIQALSADMTSIENTIAGYAQSFTTHQLNADELCLDGTCITQQQLAAILASENQSPAGGSPASGNVNVGATTPATPPVIQINGNNPAIVQVGATYTDLGATITGPQADLNLGSTTYVNGTEMNPVQIDTSTAATDTIDYVATDQNGLTSTSTRTVIVEPALESAESPTGVVVEAVSPPPAPPAATSTPVSSADASATTSAATTTVSQ